MTALVWLRNDLRITDNRSLNQACDENEKVIAVYCITEKQWQEHNMSAMQIDLILRKLTQLRNDLIHLNIPLIIYSSDYYDDSIFQLLNLIDKQHITSLYYQVQYEWNEQQRDIKVNKLLPSTVEINAIHDLCLIKPGQVKNLKGEMFKVFTPFRNKWLNQLNEEIPYTLTAPIKRKTMPIENNQWTYNGIKADSSHWLIDHKAITAKLTEFFQNNVSSYKEHRDLPSIKGTSNISPYLALGFISVRQCIDLLYQNVGFRMFAKDSGAFTWFNELIWRDFYKHIINAYPKLSKNNNFITYTNHISWDNDPHLFSAWCRGETGFPIVDAAMRQLNTIGWMHNRLRMIVASFLVKDLLIDWRWGERYFSQHLVDWDLAANNGGWQWAASTGTDSQPYFRIFNPTTQGQRFDPTGTFINDWVPELKEVPSKYKNTPWEWANKEQIQLNYPQMIVNHSERRIEAIARFANAKSLSKTT